LRSPSRAALVVARPQKQPTLRHSGSADIRPTTLASEFYGETFFALRAILRQKLSWPSGHLTATSGITTTLASRIGGRHFQVSRRTMRPDPSEKNQKKPKTKKTQQSSGLHQRNMTTTASSQEPDKQPNQEKKDHADDWRHRRPLGTIPSRTASHNTKIKTCRTSLAATTTRGYDTHIRSRREHQHGSWAFAHLPPFIEYRKAPRVHTSTGNPWSATCRSLRGGCTR